MKTENNLKFMYVCCRELQRLDSITRSPIFSHFSETLGGLTTIRAFGHQPRFKNLLFSKADAHTNAFLIMNTSNRWLGIALVCILYFLLCRFRELRYSNLIYHSSKFRYKNPSIPQHFIFIYDHLGNLALSHGHPSIRSLLCFNLEGRKTT